MPCPRSHVLSRRALAVLARAALALLAALVLEAAPVRAEAPALQLFDSAGAPLTALRQESELELTINGLVAVAVLTQRFDSSAPGWTHGVYRFPLPEEGAVRRLDFVVGKRLVRGRVRERARARETFDRARAAGKQAALLTQERPHLFTSELANIPPGARVELRLELVLPVSYRDGAFSLRFPGTLTAPYIPGTPVAAGNSNSWSPPTDRVPDAHRITPLQYPGAGSDRDPLNPLRLKLTLDAGVPLAELSALYHDLAVRRDGERYRATLRRGAAEMDRDLVLRWRPVRGAAPTAALYQETKAGEHYAYLMLLPPRTAPVTPPPREMVFVIDRSGSMGGAPIEQARASVLAALDRLRPADHFNVIAFDDRLETLFATARSAGPEAVARARRFVGALDARGGTEMHAALLEAFPTGERDAGERLRQVVFITDGAVGNEQELFGLIRERLGPSRLFTVGIGAAPNSWFMRRAAEAGRGTFTHIGDRDRAGAAMDTLLARLEQPALTTIEVDWPAGARPVPPQVPDLYRGEPVLQAVALEAPLAAPLRVHGDQGGERWSVTVPLDSDAQAAPGVATLWARGQVQRLLDGLEVGAERSAVREQVLPLALTHELLTPFTAFVAVESLRPRPDGTPAQEQALPNTRPAGQAPQQFAFPRTATTARARLYLGLFALFIVLIVVALREEGDYR
jgi:Ca-activated chloride channel family protein